MKQVTKRRLSQLHRMAEESGERILERFKLAKACLADQDWIAEEFNGEYAHAIKHLQAFAFSDLCSFVSLSKLLALYDAFPDPAEWKRHHYDLRAMIALWEQDPKVKAGKRSCRRVTLAQYQEMEERAIAAEKALAAAQETIIARDAEISGLRDQLAELRQITAELRGELTGLRGRKAKVA